MDYLPITGKCLALSTAAFWPIYAMSLLLTGWPRIKGLVLLASKLLHKLQDIVIN
ncbi:hypothetical protein WKH40_11165 [Pantoea agglomerans]